MLVDISPLELKGTRVGTDRSCSRKRNRMAVHTLEHLFEPRSIAVFGASNTPHRVGNVIMRNLLEGGFSGPIMPVNPKYRAVAGA